MNRVRGGQWLMPLPFVVFYAVLGAATWFLTQNPWFVGTVLVGGLLDWKLSWGWCIYLNRMNPTIGQAWGPDDKRWKIFYVKAIKSIAGDNDYLSLFIRRLFILPMFVGMVFLLGMPMWIIALTVAHAALMVVGYHIGWAIEDKVGPTMFGGVGMGEIITGAFFGAELLYLISLL